MSSLVRFGVSLEQDLLARFDRRIKTKKYANRSKAIGDLIREDLIREDWGKDTGEVAGAVTVVYDHHKRELVNTLLEIQHDYQTSVISTQHVHLDHHHCLEVIVVKGKPSDVRALVDRIQSEKGVKHASLTMTTTGREHG